MLKEITRRDTATVILPQTFSFGSKFPSKVDVVFVGALIHWVYTCTADFGKFNLIMDYLLTAARKALVIEWVDPLDPAVKSFNHIECGKAPQESYGVSGFEHALRRVGRITERWPLPGRPTKVMYVVRLLR
jgi:hypothetical protein